jgi:hypothetical protein
MPTLSRKLIEIPLPSLLFGTREGTDCVKLLFDGAGKHAALTEQVVDLSGVADLPPLTFSIC